MRNAGRENRRVGNEVGTGSSSDRVSYIRSFKREKKRKPLAAASGSDLIFRGFSVILWRVLVIKDGNHENTLTNTNSV
jgi:hypothetical protein